MKNNKDNFKYKILIKYETGDSLSNENTDTTLDIGWNDLMIAKENLKAIKDHYQKVYKPLNSYINNKEFDDIIKEVENEFWFVKDLKLFYKNNDCPIYESDKHKFKEKDLSYKPVRDSSEYCINIKLDNGTLSRMRCNWCGHFETLQGAEIIEDNSDMKFEI